MKEKIIAILKKHGLIGENYPDVVNDFEKLYQKEYLNDCIKRAEPNLSKIKDVDKELAEIRGEIRGCLNCKHDWNSNDSHCVTCWDYDKWELKTE